MNYILNSIEQIGPLETIEVDGNKTYKQQIVVVTGIENQNYTGFVNRDYLTVTLGPKDSIDQLDSVLKTRAIEFIELTYPNT